MIAQRILYFQSPEKPLLSFGEACLSLTPKVYLHKTHEAYLDIASTEKLFGSEENILMAAEELKTSFDMEELCTVVTDRPEWAKAFAVSDQVVVPRGKSVDYLLQLPIERLAYCGDPSQIDHLFGEQKSLVAFMRRVGMTHIRHFAQLGPTTIGRRFGKQGIALHQWLTGRRELRLPEWVPLDPIRETLHTDEICNLESLLSYLKQILVKTEARLRGRSLLAKQLCLYFFLESGNRLSRRIDFSEPTQEAYLLLSFLQEVLRNVEWDSPLQSLEIEVTDSIPFVPGQLSLWDNAENRLSDLGQFIRRWRARFGDHCVGFPRKEKSYLPEKSWSHAWPPSTQSFQDELETHRPPFLYHPPRPFQPRESLKMIPSENLATEWWEKDPGYRRYFIAWVGEEQIWIFWDVHQRRWFLHGTFD